jgi:hypothetical protein
MFRFLHYFASDSLYSIFALFFGISLAMLSCYINWTLSILNKTLKNIPEASLIMVNVKKVYTFFASMEQLPGITLIFKVLGMMA